MRVDPIWFTVLCTLCGVLGMVVGWMGGVVEGRQQERRRANVCAETGESKDPRSCWNVRCQLGGTCCRTSGVDVPRTDHIRSVPGGAAFLRVAARPCPHCDAPPGSAHSFSCPVREQPAPGVAIPLRTSHEPVKRWRFHVTDWDDNVTWLDATGGPDGDEKEAEFIGTGHDAITEGDRRAALWEQRTGLLAAKITRESFGVAPGVGGKSNG